MSRIRKQHKKISLAPSAAIASKVNPANKQATFKDFGATHLYCPKCRCATSVRGRLLLILPDGDLHEYLCSQCGTSVGERRG